MIIDGHIHISEGPVDPTGLVERMQAAGVDGGALFSLPPSAFIRLGQPHTTPERLDNLFAWVKNAPTLYPVFWIDPLEPDAIDQVAVASQRGVLGYKVICNRFYPGEPAALRVFKAIAPTGKPIFFHSGILWDGQDSSRYNRPDEFEALLDVDQARFSLAHVSWPWCDEHIAVYGKLRHARSRRPELAVEMFVDLTPGTPPIYRQEVLAKLFTVGYEVERNVFFGTDCSTGDYNVNWAREWIERDDQIYRQLGLTPETIEQIYALNVKRFLAVA